MMTTMFDVMYCGFIISDDLRFGGLGKKQSCSLT